MERGAKVCWYLAGFDPVPRRSGGTLWPLCCLVSSTAYASSWGHRWVVSPHRVDIATEVWQSVTVEKLCNFILEHGCIGYQARRIQCSDTPSWRNRTPTTRHTHKITQTNMSGHDAPQSMTYSFTSVGKLSVYVRGGLPYYMKNLMTQNVGSLASA